jgi:outer membrane protein TolC
LRFKRGLFITLFSSVLWGAVAHAVTLPSLIQEASERNPEILEAQKAYEQAQALSTQARSPFYPEFGAEGGVESYSSANETLSDAFGFVYGRLNLYRGGKDRYGLLAKTRQERFASFEWHKTKARISRAVSAPYFALLYLQKALQVTEESLKVNATQIQMAEKRAKSGITSQADVLEFELREARLKSDVSLFQQEQEQATFALKQLLGRSDDSKIEVQGEFSQGSVKLSLSGLLDLALQERLDLKANEKDQDVASLDYSATLGEWLPRVDAVVSFGSLEQSNRVLTQVPSWDAIVRVSLPLFSGLNSYYGRKAQYQEVAKLDARGVRIRQEVKAQVQTAFSRLRALETRIELEKTNIDRAERYYDITLSEYKRGVKNSPDLAGAAERFFGARLRVLELKRDSQQARLALAEAVGVEGFSEK